MPVGTGPQCPLPPSGWLTDSVPTPAGTHAVWLDRGMNIRRGQGYTLHVSAAPAVHRQLLARCQPLDGAQGVPAVPAQRKARREYENRVSALTSTAGS